MIGRGGWTLGRAGSIFLGLAVVADGAAFHVHHQDLAGAQAQALSGLASGQRHRAGFRAGHHESVVGDGDGQRPQPVAVKHGAYARAVAEAQGGWSVPWRQQPCGPDTQRVQLRDCLSTQAGGVGDGHQQCRIQPPAGGEHQVERLVERERVGAVGGEQGPQSLDAVTQRSAQTAASTTHLLAVAAHGVDLTVVGDEAEGLCQGPARMGVGGIALVEDGVAQRKLHPKVGVEVR